MLMYPHTQNHSRSCLQSRNIESAVRIAEFLVFAQFPFGRKTMNYFDSDICRPLPLIQYRPGSLFVGNCEEGRAGSMDDGLLCKFVVVGPSGDGYATTQWRSVPFK